MTQEEKQLLLIDLCARLSYGPIKAQYENGVIDVIAVNSYGEIYPDTVNYTLPLEEVKPYLRPMSSMTEEEKKELWELLKKLGMTADVKRLDWLTAHHFDIRGLIEKGLAIEAPEGMYKND